MNSKRSLQKAGALLLLLVSNLLLCKNAASLPVCPSGAANCHMSLQDLFDRAVILSHYIHNLSSEMFSEFDKQYGQGRGFITRAINSCHTSTLPTPEDKEQAQNLHDQDFLKLILDMLRAWNTPLYHLAAEVQSLQDVPDTILSRAMEVEDQIQRLLEGIEKIVSQVSRLLKLAFSHYKELHPGIQENGVYPVWSGLPSLQTADEDSRLFAFYTVLRCLRRDSNKIDNYLKFLKCRIIHDNNC